MPFVPNPRMSHPNDLEASALAAIVAEIQEILWRESRPDPDDRRDYKDYWNPRREEDGEEVQKIAELLANYGLMPCDEMPVQVWSAEGPPASEPSEVTFKDLEQRWTTASQPTPQEKL
jgi:hypothetical protein